MSFHDPAWGPYEPERDPVRESDAVELGERVAAAFEYRSFLVASDSYSLGQFFTGIAYPRAEHRAQTPEQVS